MASRYAVLGSNSFSGTHFVALLLRAGHRVLGMSRSPEVDPVFRAYSWRSAPGSFEYEQVDLNDSGLVGRALDHFRPEIVVNFAAQSMVAPSWDWPEHWYRTNVLGLVGLAKVLESLPSLSKYVHITTPEVYGSTGGWISENKNFHPSTPYAISRAAGDMHLLALHETRGLPVCFTRAANVYGPGQQLYRIVPRTLLYARLGRSLTLDGGGNSTRSFIHIDDVANATYLVAEKGALGECYHVSSDEIVSVRELVERACRLTGVDFVDLAVDGPERPGKDDTYMLDSSLLRQTLGWRPTVGLEQGMRSTLDWVDSNLSSFADVADSYVHKE